MGDPHCLAKKKGGLQGFCVREMETVRVCMYLDGGGGGGGGMLS